MATGRDASSKTEKQRNREAKRQGSSEAGIYRPYEMGMGVI